MVLTDSASMTVPPRGLTASTGDGDPLVVWLRGELDISTVPALTETLAQAIALDDADLLLDLSAVQFMDAATVGAIIQARNVLRLRSRSLALRSPSSCARRILDLCLLADLIDPLPGESTPTTATARALGTWVEVPATDRARRRADLGANASIPGGP